MTRRDAEIIVVGAGPAGSVTAALLAERGRRVILLDKARFPRHKACSEYVNPAGSRLLADLGLDRDLDALGAHRVEGMLIHAPGGERFLADFDAAEPGRRALGLSRYRLDALLLERARSAGVEVYDGARVRDLVIEDGRVRGVEAAIRGSRQTLLGPLVVGADGRYGLVSRVLGLDVHYRWPRRTGLVAHYRGVADLGRWGEMHVAHHGYAGLAPLEEGLANVAFVARSDAVTGRNESLATFFDEGLCAIPGVAAKLAGAERIGTIRGVGPMARRARQVAGDGFLLVGDAAGFLDPFTGEGVYEAIRGAMLAAPVIDAALDTGEVSARSLAPYRAARRRAFAVKWQVSWLVQAFIDTPALMDYATARLDTRSREAVTLAGVLGGLYPAGQALSPRFLARLLRP
jgi:geranylgeranyl reductase family protein